jgi:hypothetical protein
MRQAYLSQEHFRVRLTLGMATYPSVAIITWKSVRDLHGSASSHGNGRLAEE